MFDITKGKIDRIIIHRVFEKEKDTDHVDVEFEEKLFHFDTDEEQALVKRIQKAFSKENRAFQLSINNNSNMSFYNHVTLIKKSSNVDFIDHSKNIAQLLAVSHKRKNVPGGLLLIIDGYIEKKKHFVLAVKAELQDAFTIASVSGKKTVRLLHELFLSPAQELYKIGVIVEDKNLGKTTPNDSYSCFMYDNQFSLEKNDLAEYFYNDFLGFTTSQNDELNTKRFYKAVQKFISDNVRDYNDSKGLVSALNSLIREDVTRIINPTEFGKKYFDDDLRRKYNSTILPKFTNSFTNNPKLLSRRLKRSKVYLGNDLRIEGPSVSVDAVKIYTDSKKIDPKKLIMDVENKKITLITIPTQSPNK